MPKQDVILKLNSIGELFNAPDVNPFAANEIDVLGEAALPHAARQMLARRIRHWHEARLIIQLPPDQLTPSLADATRAAWQRYCAARIENNRLRRLNTRKSLRLWGYAGILLLVTLGVIALMFAGPLHILPVWLRAVISLLAVYAFAPANWDALDALLFEWAPFVRDNTTYTQISTLELRFETLPR
jgi:hypothetical protein